MQRNLQGKLGVWLKNWELMAFNENASLVGSKSIATEESACERVSGRSGYPYYTRALSLIIYFH